MQPEPNITKQDVDHYFTKNYSKLLAYCDGFVRGFKRKYDSSSIVSESYLNCINCAESGKIQTLKDIEAFAKSTIFCQVTQETSKANYKKVIDKNTSDLNIYDVSYAPNDRRSDAYQILNTQTNSELFNIEEELNTVFEEFRDTLSNVDKILFDIVYEKNIVTGKELSAHLNIPLTSAHSSLRNINARLRLYIETRYKLKN